MIVRFDESLRVLVDEVARAIGKEALRGGVALRDASGRLCFIADQVLPADEKERVSSRLAESLGPYARPDRVFADREDPGAPTLLGSRDLRIVAVGDHEVRLLERRIVGADWLSLPEGPEARPPRVVFSSLKGGVGRSTALAILAAEQAREGRNVLVIDLDLEAPGVGSMLLSEERRPDLGTLDYLVESGIGEVPDADLALFVGTSELTTSAGAVDVLPVTGRITSQHPESYLPKLSRAMIEQLLPDGSSLSLAGRVRALVDRFVARRAYDLVLVDARAGLAELAAGPVLALGATVLLFGTAQPQTIEGYRVLLATLAGSLKTGSDPAWRERLRMVHAKATLSDEAQEKFRDDLWYLFLEYLYDEALGIDAFSFDAGDPDGPHNPIPITFDPRFVDWDPVRRPTDLTKGFYDASFGAFLAGVGRILGD